MTRQTRPRLRARLAPASTGRSAANDSERVLQRLGEILIFHPPVPVPPVTLYRRVMDETGYPLTADGNLRFAGTASTGATIDLLPGVIFPNLRAVRLRLAPTARANTFQFTFGDLRPIIHVITGTTTAP